MKKTIITITIFTLVMASATFAGDVIGHHDLSNDRGLLRVNSVEGSKMAVDIIYAPVKGKLLIID